ncbi:hypothetical protein ABBQ38_009138 [Trebouxia sp. C0009 RCD-2024]
MVQQNRPGMAQQAAAPVLLVSVTPGGGGTLPTGLLAEFPIPVELLLAACEAAIDSSRNTVQME